MEKSDSQMSAVVKYKRSRFNATFSDENLYSKAHYWFAPQGDGTYQVGLTKFAARMLGELVEFGFEVKPETKIVEGDIIGWLEGFKAASDIYSFINGTFVKENQSLVEQPELLHARPHGAGWLYEVNFEDSQKEKLLTVHEYTAFLDDLIDKMTGEEG